MQAVALASAHKSELNILFADVHRNLANPAKIFNDDFNSQVWYLFKIKNSIFLLQNLTSLANWNTVP